ncbi:6-pyruvoyl trahydropterin synthase family protein [Mucisphaera calidilacus]|uniref:6-carboxy-5,6,7,8-tetrahydropterin synthase n=1 Tax=Mucisphaera calidilacus TaxID=2527982 RepID=A0A518BTD4_9BACT|nr:6-carboxytetrahydropterin synthase [Mucisphaera calidilacus]QDU70228.1 6-pyruvoyl tetrahydropterin synthase [Mucisphaera calidilacus]
MVELTRTVRLCVNDPVEDRGRLSSAETAVSNAYSAWPAMRGLGRYYEVTVGYVGEPDAETGYLVDIKLIDRVVRDRGMTVMNSAIGSGEPVAVDAVVAGLLEAVGPEIGVGVRWVELGLTPGLRVRAVRDAEDVLMVLMTQTFEFSAAHRLFLRDRSDAENAELFGKCANPAGHGHNYRLDVTVACDAGGDARLPMAEALDAWVDRWVIEALDHKHLNVDVQAFESLNPSVEHIAQVVWGLLEGRVEALGAGVRLDEVRVWETGKTSCRYRGPAGAVNLGG